jgi:hypothetical protein
MNFIFRSLYEILCLVKDPHPAAIEFFDDAVVGDSLVDHGAPRNVMRE